MKGDGPQYGITVAKKLIERKRFFCLFEDRIGQNF